MRPNLGVEEIVKPARNRQILILFGCFLLAAFFEFHLFGNAVRGYMDTSSLFAWLWELWMNPKAEMQHGPFIVLLAGWLYREALRRSRERRTRPMLTLGALLVGGSLVLHVLGYLVQQTRISVVSLLIFLVGTAYLFGGARWGKAAIFPACFLLFALPLGFLSDELGFSLRLMVIETSYALTQGLGIDVVRNGTQLFAADGAYQYDVAPACSGMRSLTALTALSLLLGYFSFRTWRRRLTICILAFPFAFLGNVGRIFLIILVAEVFGQEWGAVIHEWFGFLIFVVVLGLAMVAVNLINRVLPETEGSMPGRHEIDVPLSGGGPVPVSVRQLSALTMLVLMLSGLTAYCIHRVDSSRKALQCGIVLAGNAEDPVELPVMLDINWLGRTAEVTQIERDVLPADTGFSRRIFTDMFGNEVFLSIVLSGKDRTSIHRPELCLVGQGWTITGKFRHRFDLGDGGQNELEASVLELERRGKNGVVPALYAYWFVSGRGTVATHWERMAAMAINRLIHFESHRWGYVVAQTLSFEGNELATQRLEEVVRLAVPSFQRVPGEG